MATFERSGFNTSFRVNIAFGCCALCFLAVVVRLWYLQIIQGDYFRNRSENNRLRTLYIPPPRGVIFDRNGIVLAKNRPSFDIDFVMEDAPKPKEVIARLAQILKKKPDDLWAQLGAQKRRRRFESKLLLKDVDREIIARVEARKYELPGVVINVNPTRDYLYGSLAAHVIGYTREISSRQLDLRDFAEYRSGDMVGQFGLEAQWEKLLQGKRGIKRVFVNASGNKIGESTETTSPVPGENLTLTIDFDVQKAADDALKDRQGAVVAIAPQTGEILALTSAPAFDPNTFTKAIPPEIWRDLITGKGRKLSNRAVQGLYPPGSVFKIMSAAAALAEGVVSSSERIFCPGFYMVGSARFGCHKKSGHGSMNLVEALIQSCDVYFYTAGQRLGIDRIHDYAKKFGLGKKTQLVLAEEPSGIIPSTEWKRRYFKRAEDQKWYPGETPSVAIGQGAVTVTPLQIARAVAALVNGGKVLAPYLVRNLEAPSTQEEGHNESFVPKVLSELGIEEKVINEVREGLVGVVNDPRGTAHKARLDPALEVTVAGKTGTAQVVALAYHRLGDNNDHAWFVGYAPAENPEIVVSAILENAGHGGAEAGPVVRQVMEAYFKKKQGPRLPKEQTKDVR